MSLFRPSTLIAALGLCLSMCAGTASAQRADAGCDGAGPAIPRRPALARGAAAFIDAVAGFSDHERDRAIRSELLAGNVPGFLRRLLPTVLRARGADGRPVQLTLCVLPDYLGVGADDDYLLVPMGLQTALAVASKFGFTLPTRRIVDLIYRQAAVRLQPQPLPAGDQMRSAAYLQRHDALVEAQRAGRGATPGELTAGHKKDVVLSSRLWSQPGRLAIYGWHRGEGAPIQSLSTVHGAQYADYSHGVRLVSQTVFVNGAPASIFDVLADPTLAPLLSDEGPLPQAAAFQRSVAAAPD